MERIIIYLKNFIEANYVTDIRFIDFVEILILAIFLYQVMIWVQNTKAWMLLRGILVIGMFMLLAIICNMQTILYLAKNSVNVLAMVAVVVFQPEIRRALENLGQKNILSTFTPFDKKKDSARFSERTIDSIVEACDVMSHEKTGALIVLENDVKLTEFSDTGIQMDCKVSTQIILNIFEHNTPLHDGAVIMRQNRIVASTCYLPLTENMNLNKKLGTRHRAAIGVSEVSDALVVAVSEETGHISLSRAGEILTKINLLQLREYLQELQIQEKLRTEKSLITRIKGGDIDETKNPS